MQTDNVFSTCFVAIALITATMALTKQTVKTPASQPPVMTEDVLENVTVIKHALTAVTKPTVRITTVADVLIPAKCTTHFKGATVPSSALTAATNGIVTTTH